MNEKYIKVVYRTEPIGKRKIILELTSFDLEAYERDKKAKEISTKQVSYFIEQKEYLVDYPDREIEYLTNTVKRIVDKHYKREIEKLKAYIEMNRIVKPIALYNEKKVIKGNIINSDNIVCDVIEGNVVNCDNIKVREIKGNTLNCEIYKE